MSWKPKSDITSPTVLSLRQLSTADLTTNAVARIAQTHTSTYANTSRQKHTASCEEATLLDREVAFLLLTNYRGLRSERRADMRR